MALKATGGIIKSVGQYTVHIFKESGTFAAFEPLQDVEILVVAGGGGGGGGSTVLPSTYLGGGGGGAGGVIHITENDGYSIASGSHNVIIGEGGNAYSATFRQTTGSNSSFDTLVAIGGGGGNSSALLSNPTTLNVDYGGSGGGGNPTSGADGTGGTGLQPTASGDSGTYGYGNNGANDTGNNGGGGGGAGGTASGTTGGIGITLNIEGESKTYAKGGSTNTVEAIVPNSGNGGSGDTATADSDQVAGSSGIVVIRYKSTTKVGKFLKGSKPFLAPLKKGGSNIDRAYYNNQIIYGQLPTE